MDHHQKHQEHHQKEREHEKAVHKEQGREAGGKRRPFHPAWYAVVGAVLIIVAVTIWIVLSSR